MSEQTAQGSVFETQVSGVGQPNVSFFFVVGTAKAGTTSIYQYLQRFPEVLLSQPKETWYFDGPDFRPEETRKDYLTRFFPDRKGQSVVGEVATSYLYVPYVAHRLKSTFPEARIVVVLRDPVARAFSDWWMTYSSGYEPLAFEDAISENLKRLQHGPFLEEAPDSSAWCDHLGMIERRHRILYRTYVDYGHYDTQLGRYYGIFGQDQVRVLIFEEVFQGEQMNLAELSGFLSLRTGCQQMDRIRANPGYRSRGIRRAVDLATRVGLQRTVPSVARRRLSALLARLGTPPRIDSEIRASLIAHYKPRISQLEQILGRDLSVWQSSGKRVQDQDLGSE